VLLIIRHRYPRIANILGFVSGVITLAIGVACGASTMVLIIGGGSSVALGVVRYVGKRHPRLVAGRGTATAR
jgi:arginase family enzyme